MTLVVVALHGFLGGPADWAPVREAWARHADVRFVCPDLLAAPPEPAGVERWLDSLARSLPREEPRVLLGYSMGGRVAMRLLARAVTASAVRRPEVRGTPWAAAIIVSANPGLQSDDERARRLERDEAWARRFEREPWGPLLAAWNAQAVFGGRPAPELPEPGPERRAALAGALRGLSLGRQPDLRPGLARLTMPTLWIAGADDPAYAAHARECAVLSGGESWVAQTAAHRVPWEATRELAARCARFVSPFVQ